MNFNIEKQIAFAFLNFYKKQGFSVSVKITYEAKPQFKYKKNWFMPLLHLCIWNFLCHITRLFLNYFPTDVKVTEIHKLSPSLKVQLLSFANGEFI